MPEYNITTMPKPHHQPHSEADWDALLAAVKEAMQRAEKSIDRTIALCDASNERMAKVEEWMKKDGDRMCHYDPKGGF